MQEQNQAERTIFKAEGVDHISAQLKVIHTQSQQVNARPHIHCSRMNLRIFWEVLLKLL